MKTQHQLKIDQTISLTIKRLGINGEGIGYYQKTIVFVPGALPSEKITAKVTTIAPRYVQAKLLTIEKTAKQRVTPPCPVYATCGGCQLQHLAYPAQLTFKRDLIRQSLQKYQPKGFKDYLLKETIGMQKPWHYRNKLQFQLGMNATNQVISGLYQQDSHQLVAIDDCLVQHPTTTLVVNTVRDLLEELAIPIYQERKNSGIVRTIMVRTGIATGETQVAFITQSQKLPRKRELIAAIQAKLPQVVSLVQNVQNKKTSLVMGEETKLLWGKESIEEHLEELVFDLSARAFFQLNPVQTTVLYEEARKALAAEPHDIVLDAYCGVGTIGLSLAKHVKEVWGMDTIPAAIMDAKKNAARLGIHNSHYMVGSAEELFPQWRKQGLSPTAIVVDPPRTGLDRSFIQEILKQPAEKLVYISCNPSTLARDLVPLSRVYQVDYIQSVDMFPQTARAEAVVKLRRRVTE